jgi:hypothetical protein
MVLKNPAVDTLIKAWCAPTPRRHAALRPRPGPGVAVELLLDSQLLPAGHLHRLVESLRHAGDQASNDEAIETWWEISTRR